MFNVKPTSIWLIVAGVTIILFGMSWLSISTLTFFSVDTGLRFVQIQALIDHQWQTLAIDYAARFVDPALRHVPYFSAYLIINDDIYLSLTPFFNLLVSLLYATLGEVGLPVVPVLGGLFTGLATYRLAQLGGLPKPTLIFLATIFVTPVWFYSLELWDHTLGTALAVWGVYGLAKGIVDRRWPVALLGGLALGLATGQRGENYPWAIAAGLSLIFVSRLNWRLIGATVAGGIMGVLPLWGLQYYWYGHPLAPVAAQRLFRYGRLPDYLYPGRQQGTPLMERGRLLTYVESGDLVTFLATLLVTVGLVLFIISLRSPIWQTRRLLVGAFGIAGLGYLIFGWFAWQDMVPGLLPTFPLIALSAAYTKSSTPEVAGRQVYHFLFSTAFLFLGLMVLLWPVFGGQQWGARYLLPIYPLLVYLAWQNYLSHRDTIRQPLQPALQTVALGFLTLTFLLQLLGIRILYLTHYHHLDTLNAVRTLPSRFILTNDPFLAANAAAATDKQIIYVSHSSELLADMMSRLAHHDVDRVGVLMLDDLPLPVPDRVDGFDVEPISPGVYQFQQITLPENSAP